MENPIKEGTILNNNYRIVGVLGQGGFGRTYLAQDIGCFDEPCVIKEFAPRLEGSLALAKGEELFKREAKTLYQLQHPQIPKFKSIFRADYQGKGRLFIAQDFVKGANYWDLLQKRLTQGNVFSELEVVQFLFSLLPVLEHIHSQGVIHRDISPDNIILRETDNKPVLIDFGSIKQISAEVEYQLAKESGQPSSASSNTIVGKTGYSPNEQLRSGQVYPCSDLYGLGATAIVLLTGKEPRDLFDPYDLDWNWQKFVRVNPQLARIINKMLAVLPKDRFQTATEIIEQLQLVYPQFAKTQQFQSNYNLQTAPTVVTGNSSQTRQNNYTQPIQPNSQKSFSKFLYPLIAIALLGGAFTAWQVGFKPETVVEEETINPNQTAALIAGSEEKEAGIKAYQAGKYNEAISLLEKSLANKRNDPEALVTLHNARIGNDKAYTIAISLPISADLNAAEEMLRGVAQAQKEINDSTGKINGFPLKVLMINDKNDPDEAVKVAKQLAKNKEVMGVIGHLSSGVSLKAADVYEAEKLVMISPTSTSVKLSDKGDYVFRTVPSDELAGAVLARYLFRQLKLKKAVVFFNSESNYSESLKNAFSKDLLREGGDVVWEFDFAKPNYSPANALKKAKELGAEIIMLAANTATLNEALQVIQVNDGDLPLLGGDSLYKPQILEIGRKDALDMVVAIPWHIQANPNARFNRAADNLWQAQVGWRTAMSYDAAIALIRALAISPSREGVKEVLNSDDFAPAGAERNIKFDKNGDRNQKIQLVQIKPGSSLGYQFVPIEFN